MKLSHENGTTIQTLYKTLTIDFTFIKYTTLRDKNMGTFVPMTSKETIMMRHKKFLTLILAAALLSGIATGCTTKTENTAAAKTENKVTLQGQTLNLEGVGNARELGGYITKDGRTVKKGLLLRSGKLADASEEDITSLGSNYNLGTIVDFRTSDEIASSPDPVIDQVTNIQIQILDETDSSTNASITGIYGADPVTDIIKLVENGTLSDDMYVTTAFSQKAQNGYREFFQVLLDNQEGKSVLWHCTGGKDRAGVAAVLVLSALGVDEETILSDFELTNTFYAKKIEHMASEAAKQTDDQTVIEGVKTLTGVDVSFMKKMLDTINKDYGSIENYLIEKIGLTQADLEKLKDMYLE